MYPRVMWTMVAIFATILVLLIAVLLFQDPRAGLVTTTIVLLFILTMFIYFTPTLIASVRGNSNTLAIGFLNLLLGWTLIGWVISLIWALAVPQRQPSPAMLIP